MLDSKKVDQLSKEERKQLLKLQNEYEAAVKGIRTKKLHQSKEAFVTHSQATKHLAEFYTKHHLLK